MGAPVGGGTSGESFAARSAIVLAAGPSSRMGSPKALLPWDGTTLLGYAVSQLRAAGASSIVVVLGAHAERVRLALPAIPALVVALNTHYAGGRSSSIRVGAEALPPNAAAVLVQSVDQPCPASVIELLYRAVETAGANVAVPVFGGRSGHPVCVSGRLVPELATVREEDQGLRAVVRRHADATVEVPAPTASILLNLNDPAAYAAAYAAKGLP
jgi:molybdenum cofactor cytidylyltransferase